MAWYDIDSDVETAARELAGNWRRFKSFAWDNDETDGADESAIIYLSHRDSGCLDKSNESQILQALEAFTAGDCPDVRQESHNHWAVGHVDGIVIRCTRDGRATEAFRVLHGLAMSLADYPVLDEFDFSERETKEENEAWYNFGASDFRSELVKLAPHHDSIFDHVSDYHLFEVWSAICTSGETCIHEDSGCYFPFDYHFGKRAGACALSWADVRTVFLGVKASSCACRAFSERAA